MFPFNGQRGVPSAGHGYGIAAIALLTTARKAYTWLTRGKPSTPAETVSSGIDTTIAAVVEPPSTLLGTSHLLSVARGLQWMMNGVEYASDICEHHPLLVYSFLASALFLSFFERRIVELFFAIPAPRAATDRVSTLEQLLKEAEMREKRALEDAGKREAQSLKAAEERAEHWRTQAEDTKRKNIQLNEGAREAVEHKDRLRNQLRDATEAASIADTKQQTIEAAHQRLQKQHHGFDNQYQTMKEHSDTLQQQLDNRDHEMELLKDRLRKFEPIVEQMKSDHIRWEKEWHSRFDEQERTIVCQSEVVAECNPDEFDRLNKENKALEKANKAFASKQKDTRKHLEAAEASLSSAKKETDHLQALLKEKDSTREEIRKSMEDKDNTIKSKDRAYESLRKELASQKEEMEELKTDNGKKSHENDEAQSKIRQIETELSSANEALAEQQRKHAAADSAQSKLAELEAMNKRLQDSLSSTGNSLAEPGPELAGLREVQQGEGSENDKQMQQLLESTKSQEEEIKQLRAAAEAHNAETGQVQERYKALDDEVKLTRQELETQALELIALKEANTKAQADAKYWKEQYDGLMNIDFTGCDFSLPTSGSNEFGTFGDSSEANVQSSAGQQDGQSAFGWQDPNQGLNSYNPFHDGSSGPPVATPNDIYSPHNPGAGIDFTQHQAVDPAPTSNKADWDRIHSAINSFKNPSPTHLTQVPIGTDQHMPDATHGQGPEQGPTVVGASQMSPKTVEDILAELRRLVPNQNAAGGDISQPLGPSPAAALPGQTPTFDSSSGNGILGDQRHDPVRESGEEGPVQPNRSFARPEEERTLDVPDRPVYRKVPGREYRKCKGRARPQANRAENAGNPGSMGEQQPEAENVGGGELSSSQDDNQPSNRGSSNATPAEPRNTASSPKAGHKFSALDRDLLGLGENEGSDSDEELSDHSDISSDAPTDRGPR